MNARRRRGLGIIGVTAALAISLLVPPSRDVAVEPDQQPLAVTVSAPAPATQDDILRANASAREPERSSGTATKIRPALADVPERVYVPNEMSNSVSVIDPQTFAVVGTLNVGSHPQHVTPDWDMARLFVNDAGLTVIDPRTAKVVRSIPVAMPYNLYFTPDGSKAIVVAEDLDRLDFYDRATWTFIRSVKLPWKGVDHLDFSLDGSYLLATTEYTGRIVRVDVASFAMTGVLAAGGLPVDVRLAPDGSVFFVSNQGRDGVSVVDPTAMKEVAFIGTGRGAHGLQLSHDGRLLYVSNRLAGSISVIDVDARRVVANWPVGGSPDMLQLSPDGRQLWTGNRYGNTVSVIDTRNGAVLARITVGKAPHGLTYFPQPGRFSIGHNGVYR